jgi:tRNA(Ile2)-agmatinylcytidine synthase
VLSELLRASSEEGVDLIGEPRLVRLNPNIPWKTRGNAALSARFGVGRGPRRRLGESGGRPIWSYRAMGPLPKRRAQRWVDAAWRIVRASASRGETGTDPALVAVDRRLPSALYWEAVRSVVRVGRIHDALRRADATVRWEGSDRGLVGAAAAIAWPGARASWELIAYRRPGRWGTPRTVEATSVRRAARAWPDLFLCEDPRTRRVMVAPHTPCPILFGLRGTNSVAPMRARRLIRSEPVDRWVLFRTNQASGDHLVPRARVHVPPYTSARLTARVRSPPVIRPGGHVAFSVADQDGGELDCVAFEPTKTLPRVARSLAPGDRVRVWGSRGPEPVLRLEGIQILAVSTRRGASRAPRCPVCRRAARSLGRQRGYRCARCRRRWPPEAGRGPRIPPEFGIGIYHPTPSARRHLAPLGPEA